MALKHQANLTNSASEYNRYLGGGFGGIDITADASQINSSRLAKAINVWKDHNNEKGISVETIPGYRKLLSSLGGKINGIYRYIVDIGETTEVEYLLIHAGTNIYLKPLSALDDSSVTPLQRTGVVADHKSSGFQFLNKFYLLDGTTYSCIGIAKQFDGTKYLSVRAVSSIAYQPTVYRNDTALRQTNMLSDYVKQYCSDVPTAIDSTRIDITSSTVTEKSVKEWIYPLYQRGDEAYRHAENVTVKKSTTDVKYDNYLFYNSISAGSTYFLDIAFKNNVSSLTLSFRSSLGASYSTIFSRDIKNPYAGDETIAIAEIKHITFNIAESGYLCVDIVDTDVTETEIYAASVQPAGPLGMTINGKEWGAYAVSPLYNYTNGFATSLSFIENETSGNPPFPDNAVVEVTYKTQHNFVPTGQSTFAESHESDYNTVHAINGCTLHCIYDDRIFFSGNPLFPNTIFYTERDDTGYVNPTYIGVCNWTDVGVQGVSIVSLASTESNLVVLKEDTTQDAAIAFLTGVSTGIDMIPRVYQRTDGLAGTGCKGVSVNFRDDFVFLTKDGLSALDKRAINLERSIGHRSSNVDATLLQEPLSEASAVEWLGYLVILFPNGHAYLADSRQVSSIQGSSQYEWYFLDGIGTWEGDTDIYRYAGGYPMVSETDYVTGAALADGTALEIYEEKQGEMPFDYSEYVEKYIGEVKSSVPTYTLASGSTLEGTTPVSYVAVEDIKGNTHLYLLDKTEEKIGGTFYPANIVSCIEDRLFIGTGNGDVCVFNTDLRGEMPAIYKDDYDEADWKANFGTVIPNRAYDRCGHRYLSGIETIMDSADVPHLTKDTVKRSTVLSLKNMYNSQVKMQVQTDKSTWSEPVGTTTFTQDFGDIMTGVADFSTSGALSIAMRERTKKWARKQYRVYSDDFRKPFGIYNIAYRYSIHGRIKN